LGQRFGKQTPLVAEALVALDPENVVETIRLHGSMTLEVNGLENPPVISLDDLVVTESPKDGWAVASEAGESFALDLEVTHELALAGLSRELIRSIQEARKNAGLDISDRISLQWESKDPHIIQTWESHGTEIAHEVLATEVIRSADIEGRTGIQVANDMDIVMTLEKV
jgi:isoleucyl-tRNA synthetase